MHAFAVNNSSMRSRADSSTGKALLVWCALTVISLIFVSLIFAAPFALARGHWFAAFSIYRGFSFACHQLAERSFHFEGYPLAVCARCAGLYMGFAIAALAYPLVGDLKQTFAPSRVWLIAAMMPLAIDWSLGFFGVWNNTHLSRFATGALLGATTVFYVVPGLVNLSDTDWRGLLRKLSSSNESVHDI